MALILGGLLVLWLLGQGGILAVVGLFLVLLALVWFLGEWTDPIQDDAPDHRAAAGPSAGRLAVREADLTQRADFTRTVSHLQSALTRRAHREALAAITEMDALLARHKAAGRLPAGLEAELEAFVLGNAAAFAGLSDEVGRALAALIRVYAPRGRLRYWWTTRALPRLRNDEWQTHRQAVGGEDGRRTGTRPRRGAAAAQHRRDGAAGRIPAVRPRPSGR